MTEWLSSDPQPVFIPSKHPELAPLLRQSTNQEPACQVAPSDGSRGLNCIYHSIGGRGGTILRYLSKTYCRQLSARNHTMPATVCRGVASAVNQSAILILEEMQDRTDSFTQICLNLSF